MRTLQLLMLLIIVAAGCSDGNESQRSQNLPREPHYDDASLWYADDRGDSIDVFYVTPTCIFDWHDDKSGTLYHHYDVYGGIMKQNFDYSLKLAEDIFASECNFYAPYYRQISLESWTEGEDVVKSRFGTAMADIKSAFRYYMEHMNRGRKFVLAGYSQGAKAVVELIKGLDSSELSRMKAAYVIGYRIDSADLKNKNIRPAEGETDTGCIICYSSVRSPQDAWPIISRGGKVCINPVNWRTDGTPAHIGDSITVTADTAEHLLIVTGYDGGGIAIDALKDVITDGNYHLSELTLYKDFLSENIDKRVR